MAKSVNFRMVLSGDVESTLDKTVAVTSGDTVDDFELVIPASSTDQQVIVAFTLAALKGYMIVSDQALTIETNSTTAVGGDTIVLVANQPLFWFAGMHESKIFTASVTTMYLTTGAIAASANFRMIIVRDATA